MGDKQSVSRKRLYRQIVDQILLLIDSGECPVGSRLPAERELADRFGVSRPTIREAVIALEAMERVDVRTGSGVYVLEWKQVKGVESNASPFELLETRVLFEGEAAALASSMINDKQLHSLRLALEEMAQENQAEAVESGVADRKFHSIIAAATNNRVLSTMIENLWDAQEGLHHIKSARQEICMADQQVRLNEHQAIYDALANRDPQSARVAMRNHFARGINALHQTTEEEAVEEVRRKLSETRERFSFNRLNQTVSTG
ncbi:MAG: FadR/GntR family transcriptional regulator [Halioglobus sp.]